MPRTKTAKSRKKTSGLSAEGRRLLRATRGASREAIAETFGKAATRVRAVDSRRHRVTRTRPYRVSCELCGGFAHHIREHDDIENGKA